MRADNVIVSVQTVTIVAIFIGASAAQSSESDPSPCRPNGSLVSRRLIANVHLQEADPGANITENLADAAERLLGQVRETHYQHKRHIDKVAGAYDMDCSEFVDFLLKQVAPERFSQIPVEPGSGFLVLKFKSNLGMQICSILAKIAHNAVAVSRQIGCVQSQRQLFDDVRIGILSNYFDVGFQPGTQWEKGVLRSDVSSLPKSKIAIDAETGSNPLRRGLAQVN